MKIALLSSDQESTEPYLPLLREMRGVEVVAVSEAQAVVVTGDVSRRRELVGQAIEADAHVLCEYPLATAESDAQAIVDACAGAGIQLTLASLASFSPAFATVRDGIIYSGVVGNLMSIHGACHATSEEYGALAANAPHFLDIVDPVLGGERAEQVYAQINSVLSGNTAVESEALVSVRFSSGVVASLDCSWSPGRQDREVTATFVGDEGSVEFSASPQLLGGVDVARPGPRWELATDLHEVMLSEFVAAVSEKRTIGPDGAAGVRALRIVEAAYESARTGRAVDLVEP